MGKIKDLPGNIFGTQTPKPPKMPNIPDPEEARRAAAADAAEELRRRRKGGRGSTILTGSLDEATVAKKTLLGQ